MKENIKTKITRIFKHHFLIPPSMLKFNKKLNDLGLSTMEQMEMLLYIENEFHIDLNDQEVMEIKTLRDAINCVMRHMPQENLAS